MEVLGLLDVPLSLILAVSAAILLYIYGTWTYNFFQKQGIPGPKPLPFLGNSIQIGYFHQFHHLKQKYGNIFGFFKGRDPVFVISDLDIAKEVFVKSFDNFKNRRELNFVTYPLNLGLFFLGNAAWKRVRTIISPTFSGGKLRAMCPAINESARTLTRNFTRTFGQKESVNMKEYFGAYTMDVIAITAFGINVDSQNDFNNPFVSHAKALFNPSPTRRPILLLGTWFPWVARISVLLRSIFARDKTNRFFVQQIKEIVQQRGKEPKEVAEKRTDFLKLMMDAEIQNKNDETQTSNGDVANGHLPRQPRRHLTTDELVGQGVLFFAAGYETTASTLNFCSFALANNPEVQEKAYQEIKEKIGDKEPNYDSIGKLTYLDNVLTETLRLFPPAVALHRRAAETITIKGVTIPRGMTVFIPAFSIQRDPEVFPDPLAFKPERHEEKNNPLSFLSFGFGPRICIGMRLALVEAKLALVHVLRKVRFERAPDTPTELTFNTNLNLLQPVNPNYLRLIERK